MLESIKVKNVALINEAELTFGEGLNILTGETGAGKSILLSAVSLALGAKADKSLIRAGEDSAFVQLVFSLTEEEEELIKTDEDIPRDDNIIILQRSIFPGKSICKINGFTVPQKAMQELSEQLLDMHGQREHMAVLKKEKQLELIDSFGGKEISPLLKEVHNAYDAFKESERALKESDRDPSEIKRELDFLKFEADEIEKAGLKEGEDENLESRFTFLSNAERVKEALSKTIALLQNDSGNGALNLISEALGQTDQAAPFSDDIENISEGLRNAEASLNDARNLAYESLDKCRASDEETAYVSERLNLINRLKEKHGNSISEILKKLNELSEKIEKLERLSDDKDRLKTEYEENKKRYTKAAERLYNEREKVSKAFSKQMEKALLGLNFSACVFEADIVHDNEIINKDGSDEVCFNISLNAGEEPKPLSRIASGGELSRIMLALKSIFAHKTNTATLVFDEIDAGISGKTAWMVGEKLARLSRDHQIICITHLPQIAAMADRHYEISKSVKDNVTTTDVKELSYDEMIAEIGRLLGSADTSDAAMDNAASLKEKAESFKKNYEV